MSTPWATLSFADAPLQMLDGDRGKSYPHGTDFSPNGHCLFLSARNVTKSGFLFEETIFISAEKDAALRAGKLRRGDIVLTTRGTVGNVALFDESIPFENIRINSGMLILRPDLSRLEPGYLYYFLRSDSMTKQIDSLTSGSAQPQLPVRDLSNARIPIPDMSEQRAIAEVLGALDDKIAANNKLAELLNQIAETTYDRARSTADTSPLLSDIVSTQYGLTTSAHKDPGPKFLRVTDINKKPWIEWETTPNCTVSADELTKYRVEPGDILVARMADPGKAALVDEGHPEGVFASYLIRLRANNPAAAKYIYYFLRSHEYQDYADGAMQGSVQKNMNAKVIVATQIPMPSVSVVEQFEHEVSAVRLRICSALEENRALAATRDALLPQLMSGKLRVKDIENTMGEMV